MISFLKMHGLGNDFVIIDQRQDKTSAPTDLSPELVRRLADRRRGIGCDQVITLHLPQQSGADVLMRIYNADGSEVAACGNATRCVGRLLMEETARNQAIIETQAGLLEAHAVAGQPEQVAVNMGAPGLDWQTIPLSEEMDTLHLPISEGPLEDPVAVSMGNPHMVFFVETDPASIPLETLGPSLERHPLFPEGANVSVAFLQGQTKIALRVWERGAGLTDACGTAACATAVAAVRRGLARAGEEIDISLPGGPLMIRWDGEGAVWMTGEASYSFTGQWGPSGAAFISSL